MRTALLALALLVPAASAADEKPKMIPEADFRRLSVLLLEDPLGEKAADIARLVGVFVIQTPDAAVTLSAEEFAWIGKDDKRKYVLLSAYLVGNALAQLNSGVKRNDRYSGLLTLFQAYRQMQKKDKKFKVEALDKLLKLHKDDKLGTHLADLEKKTPTKMTPEQLKELEKLLKPREDA